MWPTFVAHVKNVGAPTQKVADSVGDKKRRRPSSATSGRTVMLCRPRVDLSLQASQRSATPTHLARARAVPSTRVLYSSTKNLLPKLRLEKFGCLLATGLSIIDSQETRL